MMTLASKITMIRVAFIPLYMVLMYMSGGAANLWMWLALGIFILASITDWVDGYIASKSVSRIHARIEKEEESYYIEDLNSTNGTRVNGGLLSYKTRVSLKKNESVYFANEPYRFL